MQHKSIIICGSQVELYHSFGINALSPVISLVKARRWGVKTEAAELITRTKELQTLVETWIAENHPKLKL